VNDYQVQIFLTAVSNEVNVNINVELLKYILSVIIREAAYRSGHLAVRLLVFFLQKYRLL